MSFSNQNDSSGVSVYRFGQNCSKSEIMGFILSGLNGKLLLQKLGPISPFFVGLFNKNYQLKKICSHIFIRHTIP
jgi:hypothetical protein